MERVLRNTGPCALAGLALLASLVVGQSHLLPISYLVLVPDADYLHLELVFNPFELSFFSELDANKDGRLALSELESKKDLITRRVIDCLKVRVGERLVASETAGITPDMMSHHLTLRAHYPVDARRSKLTIESSLSTITSGSHLIQVTYSGSGHRQLANLDMQSARVTFAPSVAVKSAPMPLAQKPGAHAPFGPLLWLLAIPAMTIYALGFYFIRRQPRTSPPGLNSLS
jgi:hypothetical protein